MDCQTQDDDNDICSLYDIELLNIPLFLFIQFHKYIIRKTNFNIFDFCMSSQQTDSKNLYNEFLMYMKSSHQNQLANSVQVMYKKLYSQLRKNNQDKRKKISSGQNSKQKILKNSSGVKSVRPISSALTSSQKQLFTSTAKFKKIQGVKQYESMKGLLIKTDCSIFNPVQNQQTYNKILLQESQKSQLQTEIDNYKASISRMGKNIRKIKANIRQIDSKQHKFRQAYHLANNMNQYTQEVNSVNNRNYNKMISDQDCVLSQLKKMKSQNKKQLQEAQNEYQNLKKQHNAKINKVINTMEPLEEIELQRHSWKPQMGIKKLLESIDELLTLFKRKQSNYEQIKQMCCTKIQGKKINLECLAPHKAEWVQIIQSFQQKFGLRAESSQYIILQLYRQIKEQNQGLQKRILEQELIRQDYQQEYLRLKKKSQTCFEGQEPDDLISCSMKNQQNKKIKIINSNSKAFIQTAQLINSLLQKFRYVYKIYLMINMGKKRVSSQLIKVQEALDKKKYFGNLCKSQNNYEDVNCKELQEIVLQNFPNLEKHYLQQMLYILFNDIRTAIFCKRTSILEELQFCSKQSWEDLIKAINATREEAQHIFSQNFKNIIHILSQCIRQIPKNKCIPSERTILQPTCINKITSNEKIFTINMAPKVKLPPQEIDEQNDDSDSNLQGKWIIDYIMKKNQEKNLQKWSDNAKKNPSNMVRQLHALRNQNCKKFKILDLHVNPNLYKPQQFSLTKFNSWNGNRINTAFRD